MVYIHSDIDTYDRGQVCKSCGQDTEQHELYKLGEPGEKIIIMSFFHIKYLATGNGIRFDGLTGVTHVGLVNALGRLIK